MSNQMPRSARTQRGATIQSLALGVAALLTFALLPTLASATHPEVSLSGSNFEIDDSICTTVKQKETCVGGANLLQEDADPSEDWATVDYDVKTEEHTGALDDSFTQGTKEDTLVPTIESGGIPPNKSDLEAFGTYLEEINGHKYMHLFWTRVQDPSGTTNMDFEFNKSDELTSNDVTPVRTAGDLLIQYDLASGGTHPKLFVSEWIDDTGSAADCEASNSVPCWGERTDMTASGDATGSINASAIDADDADGLGDLSPRTFGEATVDFTDLVGTGCLSFGSAYLKSRSSDSFTAAAKDFIAPVPLDLDTCASLTFKKVTQGGNGTFSYTTSNLTPTSFNLTTPAVNGSDSKLYAGLTPGTYGATEGDPGNTWDLTSITCTNNSDGTTHTSTTDLTTRSVSVTLASEEDVTCTFTNTKRAKVTINKVDDDSPAAALNGAVFGIYKDVAPPSANEPGIEDFNPATPNNPAPVATCNVTTAGTCSTNNVLELNVAYWAIETTTPSGYTTADPQRFTATTAGQEVTLNFVDKREFTVITLVCRNADSKLYKSSISLGKIGGGSETFDSLDAAGLATYNTAEGTFITEEQLCGLPAARFTPRHHTTVYNGTVTIPQ